MAEIIRYDQGYHWDDGNRYDQPPSFPLPKLKGRKSMADFIPPTKGDYRAWLLNLKTQITTQGPLFSLASAEVTATVTITSAQIALEDAVVAAESALKSAREAQADLDATKDILGRTEDDLGPIMESSDGPRASLGASWPSFARPRPSLAAPRNAILGRKSPILARNTAGTLSWPICLAPWPPRGLKKH